MKLKNCTRRLTALLALAAGLLVVTTVIAITAVAEDAAGTEVYKTKCVTCHGPDGGGSAVGKSLKVADLRSAEVQSKSDAELTEVISNGKGNMPGFKGNITDEEIHAVLAHVRTLASKGDSKKK
jgi:mono/diheme cytochrome c family protein